MLRLLVRMTCQTTVTATWKAPPGDGQVLLWPEPSTLLRQTVENHRTLSDANATRIQGLPLSELRREQRQWLGHASDAQPLIAAGHQIELMHPGVWAKDILIHEVARKLDGAACHFAVDTDAPKHLQLRWPGGSIPLTNDPDLTAADWAGLLVCPTPSHLKSIQDEFSMAAASWDFQPLLPDILESMRNLGMENPSLTSVLVNALHQLDWRLGLRYGAMLASPIWSSRPYLVLVHHMLARADSFAAEYNKVLAEYRQQNGIRDTGRPWPDLKLTDDSCEVPFWLDNLPAGRRSRAAVVRRGPTLLLRSHDAEFALDPALDGWEACAKLSTFLTEHALRLSPRALTLTTFLRLLVADQFVHGIGGGRYDCITNEVMQRWFGIEPPAFSVTTATLLFPTALSIEPVQLAPLVHEGRRIRHGDAQPWKEEIVRRIASLPHRSSERAALFYALHEKLADNLQSRAYRDWESRLERARRLLREQGPFFDRELFYPLQSESRLHELIGRYKQLLGG